MKLFMFIIIATMLVGTVVQAAEVPTSAGDKAMVFMFNGFDDLSLGAYGGNYGFGMRYYIADGTAIRGGVEFGGETDTNDDADTENAYTSYGLSAVYEKHLEGACSSVSPYWGIGASFSMFADKYTDADDDTWTDKGTGFSGFGVVGFEWGFTNCMTLGGEYQAGLSSWSTETETDIDGDTDIFDEYSGSFIGFGAASVYLSVYF